MTFEAVFIASNYNPFRSNNEEGANLVLGQFIDE